MAETPETGDTGSAPEAAEDKAGRSSAKDWLRRLEPSRRQGSRIVTVVLVAAIVGGLGVLTWPKWKRHVEGLIPETPSLVASDEGPAPAAPPEAAEDTSARDDTAPAEPPPVTGETAPPGTEEVPREAADRTAERLTSLAARLDLLAERIGRLEARAARPPPVDTELRERVDGIAGTLAALDRRVAGLESAMTTVREESRSRRADALVLAVGHLREAVARAAPFTQELAGLRSVAGENPKVRAAIDGLAGHAETGVPTLAALRDRFDGAAAAAARAAVAPEDGGWVDRTIARLSSVVTVRRTGADVPGDTPGAILARAEAAVARGDLTGAVRELGKLSGAPAKAMAGWLSDARARVDADAAIATLTQIAIARIAAAEKAAGGG